MRQRKRFPTMKKKEDVNDYVTAHDAAQMLTLKMGRPIRPDYISKMAASRKHTIRIARFRDRQMYHREDIAACTVGQKRRATRSSRYPEAFGTACGTDDLASQPHTPLDRPRCALEEIPSNPSSRRGCSAPTCCSQMEEGKLVLSQHTFEPDSYLKSPHH